MSRNESLYVDPAELAEVFARADRVRRAGKKLTELIVYWWDASDTFAIIDTKDSSYLVESSDTAAHALVTTLRESAPRVDYDGPRDLRVIFRRQGNPDEHIRVGDHLSILGLSRTGREFDIDSILTTAEVTDICFYKLNHD